MKKRRVTSIPVSYTHLDVYKRQTLSYVLYLYRRAFTYFDMGYSCALAWILVAIIAVFTVIIFKTQKNWVYYESEEG